MLLTSVTHLQVRHPFLDFAWGARRAGIYRLILPNAPSEEGGTAMIGNRVR